MDESRKAFESWIADMTNSDLHRGIMLDRRESGGYSHLATENKWEAWQASRAAIEIELPIPAYSRPDIQAATMHRVNLCKDSIRAAGIKVKE
ncbi:hypothetical protein [Candidatus Erwinia dacicola]|nr:hypothetical protein [Candidatus Erwinia dacicola]